MHHAECFGFVEQLPSAAPAGKGPSPDSSLISSDTTTSGISSLLPDYAEMKKQGICCAGLVNYYLFNYLPGVAGIDPGLTWKSHPDNSKHDIHTSQILANSTSYTMHQSSWKKTYTTPLVVGKDYSYVAQDYAAGKLTYRVGDILTLSSSEYRYYHVAVYAGYYDGQHWIVHATDTPKGVGVTLTPSLPREGFSIYVTEIFTP